MSAEGEDSQNLVEDENPIEEEEKTVAKKKRTMTPERKKQLLEQLARGRATARKNKENQKTEIYKCDYCDKKFKSKSARSNHENKCKNQRKEKKSIETEEKIPPTPSASPEIKKKKKKVIYQEEDSESSSSSEEEIVIRRKKKSRKPRKVKIVKDKEELQPQAPAPAPAQPPAKPTITKEQYDQLIRLRNENVKQKELEDKNNKEKLRISNLVNGMVRKKRNGFLN